MTGAVLGISADYHDAAAALVVDGVIVAAAQEERFSRRKHDPELPVGAMAYCLEEGGIGRDDLRAVVFHGKPFTTYERILRTQALRGPAAFGTLSRALRSWTGRKLWAAYRLERAVRRLGRRPGEITFIEHHLGHAASAFHPSPFESAAVLTFDGVGEWTTTSIGHGDGEGIRLLDVIDYPHSLGLLYSTVTAWCGFDVNDGESKLMGLAPYGDPRFAATLRERVIDLREDGSYRLDPQWFDFEADRMGRRRLAELFDGGPAARGAVPGQREADLAASVQVVLEDAVLGIARQAHQRTGERRAVIAGGVALNCVANARVLEDGPFDDVWVQPAASDAGGALGAALWYHHEVAGAPRHPAPRTMAGCALGPSYDDATIRAWLAGEGVEHVVHDDLDGAAAAAAAGIEAGEIVGWFQGRMEYGPRALGTRSILADPRDPASVTRINEQVKGREGFRPLAPAVLAEHQEDWFASKVPSPYMLFTTDVRGFEPASVAPLDAQPGTAAGILAAVRSPLPACTHVDGSARLQTVEQAEAPSLHAVLLAFYARTGCPVLVNTSFNRAGEPIVRTPGEALRSAVACGLDRLVLGATTVPGRELVRLAGRAKVDR